MRATYEPQLPMERVIASCRYCACVASLTPWPATAAVVHPTSVIQIGWSAPWATAMVCTNVTRAKFQRMSPESSIGPLVRGSGYGCTVYPSTSWPSPGSAFSTLSNQLTMAPSVRTCRTSAAMMILTPELACRIATAAARARAAYAVGFGFDFQNQKPHGSFQISSPSSGCGASSVWLVQNVPPGP